MFTPKLEVVQTLPRLQEIVNDYLIRADDGEIAVDTETSGLKWYNSYVVGHCVGCSIKGTYYGFYVPVRHLGEGSQNLPADKAEEILKGAYYHHELKKILFNAKFDINQLKNHNIHLDLIAENVHDAMLLMFLRNENEKSHRLKMLSSKYVDPGSSEEEDTVIQWMKANNPKYENGFAQVPISILGPYGAKDPVLTLALWRFGLQSLIESSESPMRDGVRWDIYCHERNFMLVAAEIERTGFTFDTKKARDILLIVNSAREQLADYIFDLAGFRFNIGSNPELNDALVKLGYVPTRFSKKTEEPTWDRGALLALDCELGECLAAYRNLAHYSSAFGEGLISWCYNGRIYGSYNQIGARTGRASASEPNLQQIPTRVPRYKRIPQYADRGVTEAFEIRKAFRAPDGYRVLTLDESQFELRMLNHYAKDKLMSQAFEQDLDIHSYTACMLFNFKYDDFVSAYKSGDKDAEFHRVVSKEANFAIVYGAGARKLAEMVQEYGIKFSETDARNVRSRHKERFNGAAQFVEEVTRTVRRRGYLFNHYGRHKRIDPSKAYVGINYLIQGVTADMLKDAAIKCRTLLYDYRSSLMMMVHDETDILLHNDEEFLIPKLVEIMQDFPWCKTKIIADAWIGPSWGEQEKWQPTT